VEAVEFANFNNRYKTYFIRD
jgi:hypothetical protein